MHRGCLASPVRLRPGQAPSSEATDGLGPGPDERPDVAAIEERECADRLKPIPKVRLPPAPARPAQPEHAQAGEGQIFPLDRRPPRARWPPGQQGANLPRREAPEPDRIRVLERD